MATTEKISVVRKECSRNVRRIREHNDPAALPGYFLFITVSAPALIVHASIGENTKYLLYSHQFGEGNKEYEESYVQLFPEG